MDKIVNATQEELDSSQRIGRLVAGEWARTLTPEQAQALTVDKLLSLEDSIAFHVLRARQ